MADLVYEPPLISRVDAEFGIFGPLRRSNNPGYCRGKFVVYTDGENAVRLYAALWARKDEPEEGLELFFHDRIIEILARIREPVSIDRLLLGGGFIHVDDGARKIKAYGSSPLYGRPPRNILENSLVVPGYSFNTPADDNALVNYGRADTIRWYAKHGFSLTLPEEAEKSPSTH